MGKTHDSHEPYVPGEDAFILDTLTDPPRLVGEILGRTPGSVMSRRIILTDQAAYDAFRTYQYERNDGSTTLAVNNGAAWTEDEDAFVLGTLDDPLPEVAECLGRTLYSVAGRRYLLRHNLVAAHRERVARVTRGRDLPLVAPLCPNCWIYHNGECY